MNGITEDAEQIQCHVCGGLFKSLTNHIRTHDMKVDEYKDKFELSRSTALVGDSLRKQRKEAASDFAESVS